jgi:DNA invertase Pin-like site-specific DNA recombinase
VEELCAWKDWQIIGVFQDVQSGGDDGRPGLANAVKQARRTGAMLVAAKQDRVARDQVDFGLLLRRVSVRTRDNPEGDPMLFGMQSVFGERERHIIAERTKAALAVKREQLAREGKRLGNPNGAAAFRRAGKGNTAAVAKVREAASDRAEDLREVVEAIRAAGFATRREIADELNRRHMRTPRNGVWSAGNVHRLLARLDSQRSPT